MKIPDIDPRQYTYDLPEERIARYPLPRRDEAKLLVYGENGITDAVFRDLDQFLDPDQVLVVNNTRVIRARLFFRKPTGARIEIFCLEPVAPASYEQVFAARGTVVWECLVGNSKKWKEGDLTAVIPFGEGEVHLTASRLQRTGSTVHVRFSWDGEEISFGELLDAVGNIPIPPYLRRESEDSDLTDYQTVYAERDGSVAAPTAGLHFTPAMLGRFRQQQRLLEVTLHVGAGTFKPIDSDNLGDHTMHTEHYSVSRHLLEALIRHDGKIVAVGTTSVRTLESLYWLAAVLCKETPESPPQLLTRQWDPYQQEENMPPAEAAAILLDYMDRYDMQQLHAATQLMIVPGYRFRFVNSMITNFHMPKSTLLLLIAAFAGDDWRRIYDHALQHDYRFLSYGDAMLLRKLEA
jgi:S-adenosylmethionine:tRNA ribosyltransferase-isomerase